MNKLILAIILLICFTNTLSAKERIEPKEMTKMELEKAFQQFSSYVIRQASTQTALPSIIHDSAKAQIFLMETRRRQDIHQQNLFYYTLGLSAGAFIIALLGFGWSLRTSHHDTKLMRQQITHLESIVNAWDKKKGDKMSKLKECSFTKKDMEALPINEQKLLIKLTHFLNEFNYLNKLALYTTNNWNPPQQAIKDTQTNLFLFFIKLMAAKAYEGFKILNDNIYNKSLLNSFEGRISKSSLENLKEIEEYFTRDKLFVKIRNEYGFHYYQKNLESSYKKIPEDEKMSFYVGESMLDIFYDFSEYITNTSMFELTGGKDQDSSFQILQKEMSKIHTLFFSLHGFISDMFINIKPDSKEYELVGLKKLEDIELPYFTENEKK
jgi:hypothetical protein